MKKVFKITFFVSLAVILLLVSFCIVSALSAEASHSASIGIIGGADGPTAILVSRSLLFSSPALFLFGGVLALFVVSTIGWIATKKR